MPLQKYGVLKGRAIAKRLGRGPSPHYQVHIIDDTTDYRIAVNVKSQLAPSELLYLVNDNFRHSIIEGLEVLPLGFTSPPLFSGSAFSSPSSPRLGIPMTLPAIVSKFLSPRPRRPWMDGSVSLVHW